MAKKPENESKREAMREAKQEPKDGHKGHEKGKLHEGGPYGAKDSGKGCKY